MISKMEQCSFARAIIGVWVGIRGGRLLPTSTANEGYHADIFGPDVEMRACLDSVRSQSIGFLGVAVDSRLATCLTTVRTAYVPTFSQSPNAIDAD